MRGIGRILLVIAVAAQLPAAGARATAPTPPRLRLFAPSGVVEATRFGRSPVWFDSGAFVTTEGGPFELHVGRSSYTDPIAATWVIREGAEVESRPVPAELLDGYMGLKDFLRLRVLDRTGAVIRARTATWCPNAYERQRVSDEGPAIPTFPSGCPFNPFTKGMPLGIDEAWAVNVFESGGSFRLKDGRYEIRVSITEPHRAFFGIAPADAAASFDLRVRSRRNRCCSEGRGRAEVESRTGPVPTMTNPDPAILPDLLPLPSWGISVLQRRRGTFLTFGATVWVGGASSLVVEGFRRESQDVMDAYQYFYRDGEVIGRAPVGEMEYDSRRGHTHWHFRQFVAYRLLDETKTEVVRSTKEAFCLAPTDALDLLMPGAILNPDNTGLHTACGGPNSIWIRETLPLGWGDTYHQSVPGQSFDITNLRRGRYFIEVEANPDGTLHEQSTANNSELREIIIRGPKSARWVEVPPWNGIDSN